MVQSETSAGRKHIPLAVRVVALALALKKSLANRTTYPHEESWKPFELDFVADQYLELLLGPSSSANE